MRHPFSLSLDHIQLAIPAGSEEACREFYVGILGLEEIDKPAELAARGGLWLRSGDLHLHLGVDDAFEPARKAHPGIRVINVRVVADHFIANGVEVMWDVSLPGFDRFYTEDNCGNRLEFLSAIEHHEP